MHILQDFRIAARQFRKTPGFAITTIATLALGIGASTAIFSLVDGVMLRPLPFPQPGRLLWLQQVDTSAGLTAKGEPASEPLSYPDYFDWRAQTRSFSGLASYHQAGMTLTGIGNAQQLSGAVVSSNFFRVLGLHPALGRDFLADEEKPGSRAVILSYGLWQSTFGGSRNVAGKPITLDGNSYTVDGVMPRDMPPLESPPAAFWVTLAVDATGESPETEQRGDDRLRVIGRLRPGVAPAQAQAELRALQRNIAAQFPDTNKPYTDAIAMPLLDHLVGDYRPALRVLFAAVTLVLLIACANVAGLMLARFARRAPEMAVRSAMGAGRSAIMRQVLLESLFLSLSGGALGVLFSAWILDLLVRLMPKELPRLESVSINAPVLAFAVSISILAGLVFGLVPAWRMSHLDPSLALREGVRGMTGGRRRNLLHNWLVIAETAVSLVLLIGAGLLIRSFVQVLRVDPGFDPHHVLTAQINLPAARYPHDRRLQFYDAFLARLAALPGVRSAAAGYPLPLTSGDIGISFTIEGRPVAPGDEPGAAVGVVTPGYFETLRIPILAGRAFTARDGTMAPPVVIVNEAFARKFFPGENPIGKRLTPGLGDGVVKHPVRQIIGLAGSVKRQQLTGELDPQYYLPYAQALITSPTLLIRTAGDPARLTAALREQLAQADRDIPLFRVASMDELVSKAAAQPRFQTMLLTAFAVLALLLSALGLYSVLSYMVAQRTLEIGLRMALGAQRGDVLAWILRRGMLLAAAGLAVGLAASVFVTRLLSASGMLYRIERFDPLTFAAVTFLLVVVSLISSAAPAVRAANLDPVQTLRDQ
jgi:predicted permease